MARPTSWVEPMGVTVATSTVPRKRRFNELDGLRGLAASAVVIYHLSDHSLYPNDKHVPWSLPWGQYGVQLFFMISGFVILVSARNSRTVARFAAARFSRLYPAYWIALFLSSVLVLDLHAPAAHDAVSWKTSLIDATMLQRWLNIPNVDSVYWTLGVELQFYVLMTLTIALTRGKLSTKVITWGAVAWITVSTMIAVWAYPTSHNIDPIHVEHRTKLILNATITPYGSLFCVGMLAYLARDREQSWISPAIAAVAASAQYALVQTIQSAVIVAVLALVFLLVAWRPETKALTAGPLKWLGTHSYSLYIGHLALGLLCLHLLTPHLGVFVSFLIALITVAAWTIILHRVGEVYLSSRLRALLESWIPKKKSNISAPS